MTHEPIMGRVCNLNDSRNEAIRMRNEVIRMTGIAGRNSFIEEKKTITVTNIIQTSYFNFTSDDIYFKARQRK